MEFELTLEDPVTGVAVDARVSATVDATADELAAALGPLAPIEGQLFLGVRELIGDQPLVQLPEIRGARITVGAPWGSLIRRWPVGLRIRVESGPASGRLIAIGDRPVLIGRSPECDLILSDPEVSARHLRFHRSTHEVFVSDLGSCNGTFVDDLQIHDPSRLSPGAWVTAGSSTFSVASAPPDPLARHRSGSGTELVTRAFRNPDRLETLTLDLPVEPTTPARPGVPWIAGLVPLALALGMAWFLGRPEYLLFALMGPIMLGATHLGERRRARRQSEADRTAFAESLARLGNVVDRSLERERVLRRVRSPSVTEWVEQCRAPGGRLWERRTNDDDLLEVRVGVASLAPSSVEVRTPVPLGPSAVPPAWRRPISVPATLDLARLGVIGISGPSAQVRAAARALVLQLAAAHGPDVVRLVLITRDGAHGDWSWIRWLPHVRNDSHTVAVGLVPETVDARLTELVEVIEAREAAGRSGPSISGDARIVVFLEDASTRLSVPSVGVLLRRGPAVGVHTVCTERRHASLPAECSGVVRLAEELAAPERAEHQEQPEGYVGLGRGCEVEVVGADAITDVTPDLLDPGIAEAAARAMARLEVAGDTRAVTSARLPDRVRLLDLLQLRNVEPEVLRAAWSTGATITRAVVGVGRDGPYAFDLVVDGPHALVAGTSGAGKSQFLMSLVVSLAVANPPDCLAFVLIDFKGGGAFDACAQLPHTVAMVTNLERAEAERAIDALVAEGLRRQAAFRCYGGDYDTYHDARRVDLTLAKEARLVIVVDEFAQLKEDHPDLMDRFSNVARLGRSLGMHLILGTQRPAGVVDGQIRANASARVALRVLDAGDSMDVIDAPHAALIPAGRPGRAWFGGAGGLTEVQTAAVGLPCPARDERSVVARASPWIEAGHRVAIRDPGDSQPGSSTDLHLVVELIRRAAEGFPVARPPFLPPLPDRVTVAEVRATTRLSRDEGVVGLIDQPLVQGRSALALTVGSGHLLLVGAPGAGRSTAIRTLMADLAEHHSVSELHLHVIDLGAGLTGLDGLAQVGTFIRRDQRYRVARLVQRLSSEVRRRAQLLESDGLGSFSSPERADRRPAAIVVCIDRWEALVDAEGGPSAPLVLAIRRLMTEGTQVGLSFVVSSDLRQGRLLSGDMGRVAVFDLHDRHQYADLGIDHRRVPSAMPPGRVILGGTQELAQVAVTGDGPAVPPASPDLAEARHRSGLIRVDALPQAVSLAAAIALEGTDLNSADLNSAGRPATCVPGGVGGDELGMCWIPARPGSMIPVLGPPGSGRTTALAVVAHWWESSGGRVLRFCSEHDDLQFRGDDPRPPLALIDDLDRVHDLDAVERFLDGCGRSAVIVFSADPRSVTGSIRGPLAAAARASTGLLLHPDGQAHRGVLGCSLERSEVILGPPGRGLLTVDGRSQLVQFPHLG